MFRIICMVEDKHLARAMHSLAGIALNLECVPVANAVVANGAVKTVGDGTLLSVFLDYCAKHKIESINAVIAREFVVGAGRPPQTYAGLLASGVRTGVLRKRGERKAATYTIVQAKAAKKEVAS